MEPETIVVNWEIVTVDGGTQYGVANFIYGIVKKDLKNRFQEGDYVFTTPLVELNEGSQIGRTMNTTYKLDGPGHRYKVTPTDALIMRNSGISYSTLLVMRAKGLEPNEWCQES